MSAPWRGPVRAIINEAVAAEHGVSVETNKPEILRKYIYREARRLGLSFRIEVFPNEVWVVKKENSQAALPDNAD